MTHASHIFVLPGGGYENHAEYEGEPVAEWLRGLGHSAEVLEYPVAPHRYPEALDFVRGQIVKKRSSFAGSIGVLGFSAGGHLAGHAALAPSAHRPEVPDFALLCYPVTLMGELLSRTEPPVDAVEVPRPVGADVDLSHMPTDRRAGP